MVSNFQVEFGQDSDGSKTLQTVPVYYGDPSRQASVILKNNSENMLSAVPAMAVYVSALNYDRSRLLNPYYEGTMRIREQVYDATTQQYTGTQDGQYTVSRYMPAPYKLSMKLDIWTSNLDQKWQLIEQITPLFNPGFEIQSTDNYVDWTSLTVAEIVSTTYTNRSIPMSGDDVTIDIATLEFEMPIWISTPAKVQKGGVVQQIIANIYDDTGSFSGDIIDIASTSQLRYTPMNYSVVYQGNMLTLYKNVTSDSGNNGIESLLITDLGQGYFESNASIVVSPPDLPGGTQATIGNISVFGNGAIDSFTVTNSGSGYSRPPAISIPFPISSNQWTSNGNAVVDSYYYNTFQDETTNFVTNYYVATSNGIFGSNSIGPTFTSGSNTSGNVSLSYYGTLASATAVLTESMIGQTVPWENLVNLYGKLVNGTSQVRLTFDYPDGPHEIVGTVAYNPVNGSQLIFTPDDNTLPANTLAAVNAIIDPFSVVVKSEILSPSTGTRYLIVNPIGSSDTVTGTAWNGPAGTNLVANANDIIQYNGSYWVVAFDSENNPGIQYITNMNTNSQYEWTGSNWVVAGLGIYRPGSWSLVI
jgi:hypothetical protein